MQRIIVFLTILLFTNSFFSQKIEIPAESFPFYDVIEWKGQGALLMNRDPNSSNAKINLTFVSNENSLTWKSTVNCSGKNTYFISSENSRYNYFFDNLTSENGKFSYSQVAPSGYVKFKEDDIYYHIKKTIPIEYENMEVVDIVTTDKALLYIFKYHDKKNKKVIDILVSMTHNNFILYTGILGETTEETLKSNPDFGWEYIGFTGEQIYFSAKGISNKKNGTFIKEFTTRVEPKQSFFIEDINEKFESFQNVGYGVTGKNYFKHEGFVGKSVITNINAKFYLSGYVINGGVYEFKTYELKDNKWELKSQFATKIPMNKKISSFGVYPLNEGLIFKVDNNLVFLSFTENYKHNVIGFKPELVYNPSALLTNEIGVKESFVINDRVLFFDRGQLGKKSVVIFEFKLK